MKIIKDALTAPKPPAPPFWHSCGAELQRAERRQDLFRRFGLTIQCSCGCCYELRPIGAFRYVFGVGWNSERSEYAATQYWHYLGWRESQ